MEETEPKEGGETNSKRSQGWKSNDPAPPSIHHPKRARGCCLPAFQQRILPGGCQEQAATAPQIPQSACGGWKLLRRMSFASQTSLGFPPVFFAGGTPGQGKGDTNCLSPPEQQGWRALQHPHKWQISISPQHPSPFPLENAPPHQLVCGSPWYPTIRLQTASLRNNHKKSVDFPLAHSSYSDQQQQDVGGSSDRDEVPRPPPGIPREY